MDLPSHCTRNRRNTGRADLHRDDVLGGEALRRRIEKRSLSAKGMHYLLTKMKSPFPTSPASDITP